MNHNPGESKQSKSMDVDALSTKNVNLIDVLRQQIEELRRGVRPAGHMTVHQNAGRLDELDEFNVALRYFNESGIEYVIEPLDQHHIDVVFFLARNSYLHSVVRGIRQIEDQTTRDWAWGKLFGYSDESIREYIAESNADVPESPT